MWAATLLTKRRLDETVPIGNAAMKDRTFIEWDKDDIDALGLMKVDVLALGMLTALKKSFDMIPESDPLIGKKVADIADLPQEEPEVYKMLSRADSIGSSRSRAGADVDAASAKAEGIL
jgi:error-prone DNA polymerase